MSIFDKYDLIEKESRPEKIELPNSGLILIQGSSGSGKTTILGDVEEAQFDDRPIIESFISEEEGERLLIACGLRSIPTWLRPFHTLSNGEAHRAQIALSLSRGVDTIDEFTSVVDRNTAKSLSVALNKHFRKSNMTRLVLATCHKDVREWLCPDHTFDTDSRQWLERGSLRRPDIKIDIKPASFQDWIRFKKHHYLSAKVSKSCHFYMAYLEGSPVAFSAVIHGCGRDIRSYWRGSRLVVLPEFQGLGIGSRFSEAIAEEYVARVKRFFSKTAHSALGEYRNAHPDRWSATSTNMKSRPIYLKNGVARASSGYGKTAEAKMRDAHRVCYSHEFITLEKMK